MSNTILNVEYQIQMEHWEQIESFYGYHSTDLSRLIVCMVTLSLLNVRMSYSNDFIVRL